MRKIIYVLLLITLLVSCDDKIQIQNDKDTDKFITSSSPPPSSTTTILDEIGQLHNDVFESFLKSNTNSHSHSHFTKYSATINNEYCADFKLVVDMVNHIVNDFPTYNLNSSEIIDVNYKIFDDAGLIVTNSSGTFIKPLIGNFDDYLLSCKDNGIIDEDTYNKRLPIYDDFNWQDGALIDQLIQDIAQPQYDPTDDATLFEMRYIYENYTKPFWNEHTIFLTSSTTTSSQKKLNQAQASYAEELVAVAIGISTDTAIMSAAAGLTGPGAAAVAIYAGVASEVVRREVIAFFDAQNCRCPICEWNGYYD